MVKIEKYLEMKMNLVYVSKEYLIDKCNLNVHITSLFLFQR